MIPIQENLILKSLTTWHLEYKVRYYTQIKCIDDLNFLIQHPLFKDANVKKVILGKGANTLFSTSFIDALVISVQIKGKELIEEHKGYSFWKIMAGEDWCDLVDFLVIKKSLSGIENLALIPGKVGAAPIQNIAAYGQVFEDVCEEVHCFNLESGKIEIFTNQQCHFAYRNSFFKQEIIKGNHNLIVVAVVLKLSTKHKIDISYESNYESLRSLLLKYGRHSYSVQQVYQSIIELRKSKLPNINEFGTNGSLFMNPIIKGIQLQELLSTFPDLQFYSASKMKHQRIDKQSIKPNQQYKIAAGHILEKIGWRKRNKNGVWKPKVIKGVGVWHKHSLVLVNYATNNPKNIVTYIQLLQDSFFESTGINIVPEINVI